VLQATNDLALTSWLLIAPLFVPPLLTTFVGHEVVVRMRGSCQCFLSGNRGLIVLEGVVERLVEIRTVEEECPVREHFVLVGEVYRCVVLSSQDGRLCLRFRSMGLDSLEVSEEIVATLFCESHGVSCGFGGRRLRCLQIFGRGERR
jgi:hypothetical protein